MVPQFFQKGVCKMTRVRRLAALLAALAGIAVLSSAQSWGDNSKTKGPALLPRDAGKPVNLQAAPADIEVNKVQSRFAQAPVFTYRPLQGDAYFALQLKPELPAGPRRPRDLLIMVSTDASQAGPNWFASHDLTEALLKAAAPEDRVSLWTVSTPEEKFTTSLTKGFVPVKDSAKVFKAALTRLKEQFPAGDTDLKQALTRALNSFGGEAGRQRVLIYLGNGMSTHAPLTASDRNALSALMVVRKVTFFPVPMGRHLHPDNLHGLATGSGGAVVRIELFQDQAADALKKLETTLTTPVLYPAEFTLSKEVTEFYPTKLPPLRGDQPTLVLGRMKAAEKLTWKVSGTVAGQPGAVTRTRTEAVPESEIDNYFLVNLAARSAQARGQYALFRGDRAGVRLHARPARPAGVAGRRRTRPAGERPRRRCRPVPASEAIGPRGSAGPGQCENPGQPQER